MNTRLWLGLACAITFAAALALSSCEAPPTRQASPSPSATVGTEAPALFDDFGALHRDIGTPVPAAQRYFDQGLRMAYGFNHEAASRAFAEAARQDPSCAICVWGQALVLGPNINLPMDPSLAGEATSLARRAQALSSNATPADRALIDALAQRYADPAPDDRKPLDQAYADAMQAVVRAFPDDDDALTLYAEARMDLSPWAYWLADGKPAQHTPEILVSLERVLARNPRHFGAMHYYIHATEASPDPGRAEPYADAIAALAPGSGHLVHMPAHTYIRVGRYHDATLTNFAATTADKAFLAVCRGSNGVYPLGYVPHNWHFATMTASLTGSRTLALEAARQTAARADHEQLETLNFMQQFVVTPLMAQVRFGQWDAILAQDTPPAPLPYPAAIWHFARGMALTRNGRFAEAEGELTALQSIAMDPAMASLVLWDINRADHILAVASHMLRGELALARGEQQTGVKALQAAVEAEDALNYNEPADWPLPTRQYLGAALLSADRPRDAITAYKGDLETYPHNGWSLYGLALAQRSVGDAQVATNTMREYKTAWQWADMPLQASRY